MEKLAGARLVAFDDYDVERLNKFKTGEVYEVEIKLKRNEAKSLSYGSMKQEEFEHFYNSVINAAMKHVFKGSNDEVLYNKLLGFF